MSITKNIATPLQRAVIAYEQRVRGRWKPTDDFYNYIGINQKRFGMLLRGELLMNSNEIKALAEFFDVSPLDLLDTPPPTPRAQVA